MKSTVWEGLNIREDRTRIQLTRFHFVDQVRDAAGFDLHMSDFSQVWENSSKSESNAVISRAEGEVSDVGMIHTGLGVEEVVE